MDLVDLRTSVEIFGYQPGASLFDDPSLRDGPRQMNERHLKAVRVVQSEHGPTVGRGRPRPRTFGIARGLLPLPHRSGERAKRPAEGGGVDTSKTLPKLSGDGRGTPETLAAKKNLVV